MAEIPDGPIAIEIIENKPWAIKFRFRSFPKKMRDQRGGFLSQDEPVMVDGWEIASASFPDVNGKVLFCPGLDKQRDDRVVTWSGKLSLLHALIAAGNGKSARWLNLVGRVNSWREREK